MEDESKFHANLIEDLTVLLNYLNGPKTTADLYKSIQEHLLELRKSKIDNYNTLQVFIKLLNVLYAHSEQDVRVIFVRSFLAYFPNLNNHPNLGDIERLIYTLMFDFGSFRKEYCNHGGSNDLVETLLSVNTTQDLMNWRSSLATILRRDQDNNSQYKQRLTEFDKSFISAILDDIMLDDWRSTICANVFFKLFKCTPEDIANFLTEDDFPMEDDRSTYDKLIIAVLKQNNESIIEIFDEIEEFSPLKFECLYFLEKVASSSFSEQFEQHIYDLKQKAKQKMNLIRGKKISDANDYEFYSKQFQEEFDIIDEIVSKSDIIQDKEKIKSISLLGFQVLSDYLEEEDWEKAIEFLNDFSNWSKEDSRKKIATIILSALKTNPTIFQNLRGLHSNVVAELLTEIQHKDLEDIAFEFISNGIIPVIDGK